MRGTQRRESIIAGKCYWVMMLLLLCFGFTAIGQTAAEDLKKVSAKYSGNKFNMEIIYSMFPDYTAVSSIEKKQFSIHIWENQMSVKVAEITLIRNNEYSLYVNSKQKVMILNAVKVNNGDKSELQEMQSIMNPDSLLKQYEKVEKIGETKNTRTYRLHYDEKKSRYAYTDITINTQTFLLEKTTMYFSHTLKELTGITPPGSSPKAMPRMEVQYTKQEFPTKRNITVFSLDNYVRVSKGKKYPQGIYSSYEFIDYTAQNK